MQSVRSKWMISRRTRSPFGQAAAQLGVLAGLLVAVGCSGKVDQSADMASPDFATSGFPDFAGSNADLAEGGDMAGMTATTLSVRKSGPGNGSVTSNPAGISCGATCTGTFGAGTKVTLTASAMSGSRFYGWSGACGGSRPRCINQARVSTASCSNQARVEPSRKL